MKSERGLARRVRATAPAGTPAPEDLPPLPEGAPARPPQGRYREQYGLVIICADAREQESLYEALLALRSCPLRVVTT